MKEEQLAIVAVLTLLLRSMTALAKGLVPLVAGAAAFVQQLRERCPEAFDENGQLRPDWQEIVRAKFGGAAVESPVIHTELATRKMTVHLN